MLNSYKLLETQFFVNDKLQNFINTIVKYKEDWYLWDNEFVCDEDGNCERNDGIVTYGMTRRNSTHPKNICENSYGEMSRDEYYILKEIQQTKNNK
jgi:hypothetical protein